jgi:hypothetical protein
MNINLNTRENVLVTKDNGAMLAAGTPVWSVVNGKGVFNVPEGIFFAVNSRTGLAVDHTNVATTSDPIKIGVSLGDKPRWLSGEEFYWRTIRDMRVGTPICGNPEVVDLWWKCTECDEDYAVLLSVRDNDTMSYSSAHTDFENYVAVARPDCNACPEDCSAEATCDLVADALVTQMQALLDEIDFKAHVTRLKDISNVYCFAYAKEGDGRDDCGPNCEEFIGTVSVGLGGMAPADRVVPSAPTNMAELLAAVQDLAAFINNHADFEGSAYVTSQAGSNCCVQLHINTDFVPFAITSADGAYTPCDTSTPTADHAGMCGIRAIAAPIKENSGCLLAAPLAFYGRELNLYAHSSNFFDAVVEKVSVMRFPQNFGHRVQLEELKQDTGGQGRVYRRTNTFLEDGIGTNLDAKSRLMNAITFADPLKAYWSIHIMHAVPHTDYGFRGTVNPIPVVGSIYIPLCDFDTLSGVGQFFNAIAELLGFELDQPEGLGGTGDGDQN